jgi:hypothetical protein
VSTDAPLLAQSASRTSAGPLARKDRTPGRWLALIAGAACVVLLGTQVAFGWTDLHSSGFFTALAAHKYVWANTGAAVLVAGVSLLARGRWRWLAVAGPGTYLLAILVATAIPGGQLLAMVTAILTMAALWDTGERLLRRLGAESLSRLVPVAWLAGIGPWSLATTVLGRMSLLRWWTLGVPFVAIGAIGCWRIGVRLTARRREIVSEISDSSVTFASTGLILLTLGWAAIYTAAPEIQYDALYGKAYLPELWARTGEITAIVQHVQDSITGWFQVLAIFGHLFSATAVGRYLQLLGLAFTAATIWWWGHRHGSFGPLAAVAVVVTPHLFWQASTADDDLLLALSAFAFCAAIVESLRVNPGPNVRGTAFALGLLAGSGPSLKLHLVPLFAFLLLGWVAMGRASQTVKRRLGYSVLGAMITALPPLVLRWIETGNPILPAYNNIFHSPYWPPINETLNFPYWPHPGAFGPLTAIWKAVVEPQVMAEAAPPGSFGLLIGATVLAVLLGWLGRDRARAARVVWIALIPAVIYWWVSFRYLRYLLAIDLVSVALVLMLTANVRIGGRVRTLAIIAATLAAIASFPVMIAQFWNVPLHKPPVSAAIGRWSEASYLNAGFNERPAILAFNALSPTHARVASDAFQRVWLTGGRDIYNLHFEITPLMEIHGPTPKPTTGTQTFEDLRRLGIDWLMVTESDLLQNETGYLSQVITTHGKIEYGERGWDLYRLVERPPTALPVGACDATHDAVSSCWGVPTTRDLTVSVTRAVDVCPGEILAVSLTEAAGSSASVVAIHFSGVNPAYGVQSGSAIGGTEQTTYATVPKGATSASVVIGPSAGAHITSAWIGRLGECRDSTGPE